MPKDVTEKDTELESMVKKAVASEDKPMFFAFVPKGNSDGAMVISRKKVTGAEIKEAKERCGSKQKPWQGRCRGQAGALFLEIAKDPPTTLAKQIHDVIREYTGLSKKVLIEKANDLVEEGEEGEGEEALETPSAPPAPPPLDTAAAAQFKERLKALLPAYQRAVTVAPGMKANLDPLLAQARAAGQSLQFSNGLNVLEQLAAAIKEALQTAPQPGTPGSAPTSQELDQFNARLKALLAQAQTAQPAVRGQLKVPLSQAQLAARTGDLGQANQLLGEAEALLTGQTSAPTSTVPPPTDNENSAARDEFMQLFNKLQPAYEKVKDSQPAKDRNLAAFMAKIAQLSDAGKFKLALDAALAVEPVLASVTRAVETAQEITSSTKGRKAVDYAKCRLEWVNARAKAKAELAKLQNSIVADLPELASDIHVLEESFDAIGDKLIDQLDLALNATDPNRIGELNKNVVKTIAETIALVENNAELQDLDDNPWESVGVAETLINTLYNLEDQVKI